jgi:hypothetical protein
MRMKVNTNMRIAGGTDCRRHGVSLASNVTPRFRGSGLRRADNESLELLDGLARSQARFTPAEAPQTKERVSSCATRGPAHGSGCPCISKSALKPAGERFNRRSRSHEGIDSSRHLATKSWLCTSTDGDGANGIVVVLPGKGHVKNLAIYHEAARLNSDTDFVMMPNEEIVSGEDSKLAITLSRRTDLLKSHPAYWVPSRSPGSAARGGRSHLWLNLPYRHPRRSVENASWRGLARLNAAFGVEGICRLPPRD